MLITIGLALLVAGLVFGLAAAAIGGRGFGTRLISVAAFVFGFMALVASGFTQIGVGRVGVLSLFGAVDPEPLSQGLHLINPLKSVTQLSVRTESVSVHAGPNAQSAGDTIDAVSSDGMRMPL